MAKETLSPEQRKANKAASDKAYRERKKAEAIAARVQEAPAMEEEVIVVPTAEAEPSIIEAALEAIELPEGEVPAITRTIENPVRLFWNRRFENVNSSCAKPGSVLSFEEISREDDNVIYRVRRGKRNFFANSIELAKDGIVL